MRNFTLLFIATMIATFVWIPGNAQVAIGQQDGTTEEIPITSYHGFSYSQQLIYKSEINATGDITSISFYLSGLGPFNGSRSNDWTVYLGTTAKTEFTSNTDWVPLSDLTPVFSGTVTFPEVGNQMLITFDDPFTYDTADNLVVAVDENQPNYEYNINFGKTGDFGVNRSIFYGSNSTNPDPASPPSAEGMSSYINNIILGGIQRACPSPTDLTVNAVTTTTADISWTDNASASQYKIIYGAANFDPENAGTVIPADGSGAATLINLSLNTSYELYIQAQCGGSDGDSFLVGPVAFTTTCDATTIPYTEDFESATTPNLPDCTSIETISGNDWTTVANPGHGFTSQVIQYDYTGEVANAWFFTQGVDLVAGTNYQISYNYGNNSNYSIEKLRVSYGTSPVSSVMNTELDNHPNITGGNSSNAQVVFTAPSSDTYYFGFNAYSDEYQGKLYLDDIIVELGPICPKPTALSVGATTPTTANISWTAGSSESSWNVIYGPSNFDINTPPNSTTVSATNTTLDNLSPSTDYDFYVQAQCGGSDGDSDFSGPMGFTTQCTSTTLPYTQDFESMPTPDIPDCTSIETISGSDWTTTTYPGHGFLTQVLEYNSSNEVADAWFFTQGIELVAGTNYQINYTYGNNSTYSAEKLKVSIGTSAIASSMNIELDNHPNINDGSPTNAEVIFTVPSNGTYYFGFNAYSDDYQGSLYLDDITVDLAPSCLKPTALSVNSITATTANVSWAAGGTESSWTVFYVIPDSENPPQSTTVSVTNVTLDNLSPGTDYIISVQALCGGSDGDSDFVEPITFTTQCTAAILPYTQDFESTITPALPNCTSTENVGEGNDWITGNNGDITDLGYAGNVLVYNNSPNVANTWFFTQGVELTAGINYQIFYKYGALDFSYGKLKVSYGAFAEASAMTTELADHITDGTSIINNPTINFTVSTNGIYYFGFNAHSDAYQSNLYLDDIVIRETPSCLEPSNLSFDSVTTTSVNVNWTAGNSETEWEVRYGIPNFDPNTGGTAQSANGSPSTQLTGLTADTNYEFYVKAICGGSDGDSFFAGPIRFKTACVATDIPFTQNFNSVTPPDIPNCASLEINNGNTWETTSTSYYGFDGKVLMYRSNYTPGEADSWYFTQGINLEAGVNYQIAYQYGNDATYFTEKLRVAYGSFASSSAMINELADHIISLDGSEVSEITFSVNSNGVYYFGFQAHSAGDQSEIYIDNIQIDLAPACIKPQDLAVANITDDSAEISWTTTASQSDIYVASAGDPAPDESSTPTVSGVASPTSLSLTPNTAYDVYVRSDCGVEDGVSDWAGPVSFSTPCTTRIAPWTYDVEDQSGTSFNSLVDDCWIADPNIISNYVYAWNVTGKGATLTSNTGPNTAHSGNKFFFTEASSATGTYNYAELISPPIDISSLSNPALSFYYYMYGANMGSMSIYVNDGSGWNLEGNLSGEQQTSGDDDWIDKIIDLSGYSGIIHIKFKASRGPGSLGDMAIDDFSIFDAPACFKPVDLAVANVTSDTADISWTTTASQSDIYVTLSGDPAPDGSTTPTDSGVTSPSTLSLAPNTAYDVYVRADCGVQDGVSEWAEPVSLSTLCIATTLPYLVDFESVTPPNLPDCTSIETISGNDWRTGRETRYGFNSNTLQYYGRYQYYDADAWFLTQGIELETGVNYQISYKYGNNSLVNTEKLRVSYGTSPTASAMSTELDNHPDITGAQATTAAVTFTVPVNGTYYFGFNAFSDSYQYYLYVDDILIEIAPSCLRPQNIAVDNITSTTADLSWTAGDSETNWEIKYSNDMDFNPETEGILKSVSSSATTTLSDLAQGTTYKFYIKADCGEGDESSFAGPLSFTTTCDIIGDFIEDFDTTPLYQIPGCWSTLKVNQSSSNSNNSYVDVRPYSYVSPPHSLVFVNYLGDVTDFYLVSPHLNNLSDADHRLRFSYKGDPDASLVIGTMSDPTDESTFTPVETLNTTSDYVEYSVVFDQSYTDTHIAFKVIFVISTSSKSANLDDVNWEPMPSSPEPTALRLDALTSNTADISWMAGYNETNWVVKYSDDPDFDPIVSGQTQNVSGSPELQLTGLSPSSPYAVYVKADYGGGNESSYAGPLDFTTPPINDDLCDAIPLTLGATSAGDAYTNVGATEESGETRPSCFFGDDLKSIWFSFTAPSSGNITATTDIPGGSETSTQIAIYESPDDCTDPSTLGTVLDCDEPGSNGDGSTISLTSLIPGNTYYIQVDDRGYYINGATFGIEVSDDGCIEPTDIVVDDLTPNTADISWTAGGSETDWVVKYSDDLSFDPAVAGQAQNVSGSPETQLSGLSPATGYYVYVKADCGDGNESDFSESGYFVTPPTNDDLCDAIPLTVGADLVYDAYTNKGGTVQTGEPAPSCFGGSSNQSVWFSFTAPISGNITARIIHSYWLPAMALYEAPGDCSDPSTLSAALDCSYNGGYYHDVNMSLTGLTTGDTYYIQVDGFGTGTFGINVSDDGCLAPTDLSVDDVSTSTADISWTAGNTETSWNVIYGPHNFDVNTPPNSATVSATNTTLDNLDPHTEYDVYVQADCVYDQSIFTPKTFFTTPINDNLCDAIPLTVDATSAGDAYSNEGATIQTDEPIGSCWSGTGTKTVWFTFDAPTSGNVTVSTDIAGGTLTDTHIAIYEATSLDCNDLSTLGVEVGCDGEGGVIVPHNSIAILTGLTAGNTYYIQVEGYNSKVGTFGLEVKDNGCLAPSNLSIDDFTANTAEISWVEQGNATQWEIAYGSSGFDPDGSTGSTEIINDSSQATILGLTYNTDYDVYVRSLCGGDGPIEWLGPKGFTTLCLGSPTLTYLGTGGFQNSFVTPTQGTPESTYEFAVVYTNEVGAMPSYGFPRILLDFEGNGVFTNTNDRSVVLSPADPNDLDTTDGKVYVGSISQLPSGTNWQTRVQVQTDGCLTEMGPFNAPQVLIAPDLEIFANDIVFDNLNPEVSSPLEITVTIHNKSDFPAENFVAHLENQFDTMAVYPDITVDHLGPHQNVNVVWNITTSVIPSWNPMEVFVDYTNVIAESNELNNRALRPFTNGDFNVPGAINVQASASPSVLQLPSSRNIFVSGHAYYTDTAVQLQDSTVAGATVSFISPITGSRVQTHTNATGYFSFTTTPGSQPGIYTAPVEVTDFSLTGDDPVTWELIQGPCLPDLSAGITPLNKSILVGESVSGTIVVKNIGCASVEVETLLEMNQTGGLPLIDNMTVPPLQPGESFSHDFTATFNTVGTYYITALADAGFVIEESSENNNLSSSTIQVNPQSPDITPSSNGSIGSQYLCNASSSQSFGISNIGYVPTGAFDNTIEVYFDGTLLETLNRTVPNIEVGQTVSVSIPVDYQQVGRYSFVLTCDVPLPNGVVTEISETNNVSNYYTDILECRPNLYVSSSCNSLVVDSTDLSIPDTVNFTAEVGNSGNSTAPGPVEFQFTLSTGEVYPLVHEEDILPGEHVTFTTSAPEVNSGGVLLSATVDPNNLIDDIDRSNNSTSDLLCWEFEPVPLCGYNFWDTVYNENESALLSVGLDVDHLFQAPEVDIHFEVSGPGISGWVSLGNTTVQNAIKTCGCPSRAELPTRFVFNESGVYTFRMTADPDNEYDECNEANNVLIKEVTVANQPDMRILSQYINPTLLNPDPGETIFFDITYENIGYSNVDDRMDLNVLINNQPHAVMNNVPGLIKNRTNTIAVPIPYSSEIEGLHVVRAIIDPNHDTNDLNWLNNEATRRFVVGAAANLFFNQFTVSNETPEVGETIDIDAFIANDGELDVDAEVLFSYISAVGDTIAIGTRPVSVPTGADRPFPSNQTGSDSPNNEQNRDHETVSLPWTVAESPVEILGEIINSTELEFDYNDNFASAQLNSYSVSLVATPACEETNSNGSLTANATGGVPPYSFYWSNGHSGQVLEAPSGTYSVTVIDDTGKRAVATGTIEEDPNCITPSCSLSAVSFDIPSSCNPVSGVYATTVVVAYENEPTQGSISVNGTDYPITGSPQSFEVDFYSGPVVFNIYFTDDNNCNLTIPTGVTLDECEQDCEGTYGGTVLPGTACTDANGDPGVIDEDCNCQVDVIPTCPAPIDLVATNISVSSATLGWTETASATSWNIEYGTVGFDQGSGTLITSIGDNPFELTGLAPNTQYDFYVQSNCSGGDQSAFTGPGSFSTSPVNDNLCDAIALTIDASSTGDAYTNIGATTQTSEPIGSCWLGTDNPQTVWFTFVAPASTNVTATTDILGGTLTNTHIAVYEASVDCTDLSTLGTEVGCDEDGGFIVGDGYTSVVSMTGLIAGNTYYIQVDGYNSQGGTFGLEVKDDGFVYQSGVWTPNDPNDHATPSDNITVRDGTASFSQDIEVNNITVMSGATLNVESVLTINGNITNNGNLVFVSTATGDGELAPVPGTSTITGDVTVQRYMMDKRSYRMVSPAVTTTTSINANWQEGVHNIGTGSGNNNNPNSGFGTHITGSPTGANGLDATSTGSASMFTVDVANQVFVPVTNTMDNELTAGNPYLMFVRGDRGIDLGDNLAHSETVLRATGQLAVGDQPQTFTAPTAGAFIMFGNPYQSAVDINAVFSTSANVNSDHYYVYDPGFIGEVHGKYVTVMASNGWSVPSSNVNQYLQPGQGAQLAALGAGTVTVDFKEAYKAPGQHTSTNATGNSPVADGRLIGELYTQENYNNGGSAHDGFALLFSEGSSNDLTLEDAVKPMNFYENLGIDHEGTFLSIERREMPQPAEVYPLYSNGYAHSDYTIKLTVDGLEATFLYLDDNFTGTSTLLEAGVNSYDFNVDASNPLSKATDRFSIRTEQRLGVNDNDLLAGIRLYPNPLDADTFYINAPRLNGEQLQVTINDISGRRIFEQTLECQANTVTVPMGSDIASGVYMVTLKHGGETHTYRLIKE